MRLAVLASGSGTILQSIIEAGVEVTLVVADRPCGATEIAAAAGVSCVVVTRTSFAADFDRDGYTTELVACLQSANIELIAMAGFGTILGQALQDAYAGQVINTHPALLPSFPGWHGVEDAMEYGVKVTGTTVHIATLDVDAGPILAQAAVAILETDTVASLHERIKMVERQLYPATLQKILDRGSVL